MRPTIILKRRVAGVSEQALERFAARACRITGLRGRVTVLLTASREIRALNTRFRDEKCATDVLSFPAPPFSDGFAGDIAVSVDIAARNARQLGHSIGDEIRILILHGILHLAGYDHERDRGEMAEKEILLRRRLALPVALIERASAKRKASKLPRARARV
jgi:probable rRNA maturation factor